MKITLSIHNDTPVCKGVVESVLMVILLGQIMIITGFCGQYTFI